MSGKITDDMVEDACGAFFDDWERMRTWKSTGPSCLAKMRTALEAALSSVPAIEGGEVPEFRPNVTHYEEGDVSRMLLEEGPAITMRPVFVRPLHRMTGERELVGFEWPGKVPPFASPSSSVEELRAENERLRKALDVANNTLQSIIVDCQGASVCGEPEMGLEAIYHKASDAVAALSNVESK